MEIKMTLEEAYDLIELCLDYDKSMSDYPERYEMALQIAREVFHKQTPVRPIYDHEYEEMMCAFCRDIVSGWDGSPNYCPYCGQAIDWED